LIHDAFCKENVHTFIFNEEHFAIDVNTGSLVALDEISYKFINTLFKKQSFDSAEKILFREYGKEASSTRKEIEQLIKENLLFSSSPEYFESELSLKSLCLNIAHACNFACKYCFAKQGNYGNKNALMSWDVAKKSIDFLYKSSEGRQHLEVDFFGGEPLLAFTVVKKTVHYAKETYRDKKWRFTITTNGSLITEEIEKFLYDNDISIVLSLDGGKETNDKFRILPDGNGTFDLIYPKIKIVTEHRKTSAGYYVRGTYTKKTPHIAKTATDLHNLGFDFISLEPVITKDKEVGFTEKDLPSLKNEYEKLSKQYIESQKEKEWHFFHFNIDLEAGPCIQKRIHGCGAGIEYLAISPDGSIYPCHQFDGVNEMKLGDIYSGILNKTAEEKFKNANFLFNKTECAHCWARFYCSGGCLANNYNINGDIFKPYKIGCELQKMRIEAALFVQSKLKEMNINYHSSVTDFQEIK